MPFHGCNGTGGSDNAGEVRAEPLLAETDGCRTGAGEEESLRRDGGGEAGPLLLEDSTPTRIGDVAAPNAATIGIR
jgi:hypothetical protein